jgi:hypothetical protein
MEDDDDDADDGICINDGGDVGICIGDGLVTSERDVNGAVTAPTMSCDCERHVVRLTFGSNNGGSSGCGNRTLSRGI